MPESVHLDLAFAFHSILEPAMTQMLPDPALHLAGIGTAEFKSVSAWRGGTCLES